MEQIMSKNEKIALVTGATRGIGLETVRQLASSGVRVLLAGRDAKKAAEAALQLASQGLPVESIALDVTNASSIAAAAAAVTEKFGRLDILVNNAGVFIDDFAKSPSEQSLETWRTTFDTNLFGVVATTNAFLPLLRKSAAGRVVNVSSGLGSLTLHSDPASGIYDMKLPAYNISKTALNGWTVHLAHELRGTKIKVNAIHPGSVKTDMNANGDLDIVTGAKSSVAMALLDDAGATGSFVHLGEVLPW
jgi:NAD(P)-dependent dehydrogenase (short-subunit alcohol dehydrogenase family)